MTAGGFSLDEQSREEVAGIQEAPPVLSVRVRRQALGYTAAQMVAAALSTVAAIVTARWLGPAGRGQLATFTTWCSVVAVVALAGLHPALSSLVARDLLGRRAAFRVATTGAAVAAVAGVITGYLVAVPAVAHGFGGFWLLVGLGAAALHASVTQQAVGAAAGRLPANMLNAVATATAMCLGYIMGWWLWPHMAEAVAAAAVVFVVAQSLGDALGWVATLRAGPRSRSSEAPRTPWREVVRLAAAGYPHTLLSQLVFRADILILAWLAGAEAVGVYSLASMAVALVLMAPQSLGAAAVPAWSQVSATDLPRNVGASAATAIVVSAVLGGAAAGGTFVVARWLLGPGFGDLTVYVLVMLPGAVAYSVTYVGYSVLVSLLGRPGLVSVATGVTLAVDVALLVLLAPEAGALGAAVASSVSYACGGTVMIATLQRATGARLRGGDFRQVLTQFKRDRWRAGGR